ncbi:MAG: TPR repeat-containing protein YrrB [Syntrophorhabdus sp. PtaU1.Bin050]|nr:MAG: TPR repeat-containing protein YrrB [Syntrophorhabdus sp. PtaU1.Bin050]
MCADCGVGLVNQLPPGPELDKPTGIDGPCPPDSDIQFEYILDTFNATDVAVMKCALDAEDIDYWFNGEFAAANLYGSIPMRLMVRSDQAEKTREILKGLDLNISQVTLTGSRNNTSQECADQDEDIPPTEATSAEASAHKRGTGTPSRALKYVLIVVVLLVAFVFYARYRNITHSPEEFYAKGEQSWAEHNPSKARSYYEKALKANPKSDNYHYKIGTTYEMESNLDRALRHYDASIELNPKNTEAYHRRAYVYLKLGNYERAQKEFDKTIGLNPRDPTAYVGRAYLYERMQDYEAALRDYEEAIKLDPLFPGGYLGRGSANEMLGNRNEAVSDFSKVIELEPKNVLDYTYRGHAHSHLGNHRQAIGDFSEVLSSYPRNGYVYYARGRSYLDLKDYRMAMEDCNKALNLDSTLTEAYLCRGTSREKLGDCARAIKDYNKAIEREPNHPGGYNSMAWVLATCADQKQRDGGKALQYAQKAIMLAQKNGGVNLAECYDTLAAAYAETGEFEKAAQMESKAYDLFRPLYEKPKDKADMKERIDAYKNRETFAQWKSKKPKE